MYLFCFLSASNLLILLHVLHTSAADLFQIQQTAQLHGKYGPNELLAGAWLLNELAFLLYCHQIGVKFDFPS